MGTWSVPYQDTKSANKFAKLMAKPWKAMVTKAEDTKAKPQLKKVALRKDRSGRTIWGMKKVMPKSSTKSTTYSWEVEDLYNLFGDDVLFDILGALATKRKRGLDARKEIKNRLYDFVKRESFHYKEVGRFSDKRFTLPAMNKVRKVLGWDPLSKVKAQPTSVRARVETFPIQKKAKRRK